jgi:hypothetical protein
MIVKQKRNIKGNAENQNAVVVSCASNECSVCKPSSSWRRNEAVAKMYMCMYWTRCAEVDTLCALHENSDVLFRIYHPLEWYSPKP